MIKTQLCPSQEGLEWQQTFLASHPDISFADFFEAAKQNGFQVTSDWDNEYPALSRIH